MKPPTNPHAYALYQVHQLKDLTPVERSALLAIWQIQGLWKKPIGPRVVGHLCNISTAFAKKVLAKLKQRGYLRSDGGDFRPGFKRVATRQITAKAGLPDLPKSVTAENPQEAINAKIGDHVVTENEKTATKPPQKIGDHTDTLTVNSCGGIKSPPQQSDEDLVTVYPFTWGKADGVAA